MSRILHILSQIPSKTGSGIFLDNMIHQGNLAGHEQGLVVCLPATLESFALPQNLIYTETILFETEELPFKLPGMSDVMPYESTKFSELTPKEWSLYTQSLEKGIRRAIEIFQPDVIISNHLWVATAIAVDVAKSLHLNSLKIFAVSHGTDLRQMTLAPYMKDFILKTCTHLNGVLCLHRQQMNLIHDTYFIPTEKLFLIGNGYNANIFHRKERVLSETVHLIYAGKLSYSKGVLELIEAVNALNILNASTSVNTANAVDVANNLTTANERHQSLGYTTFIPFKEIRLGLAGKGSGEESRVILEAAVESPYTDLLGFLDQPALAEVFYSSDIFVLPSFYEGLPLVVLEALATGLPVVVTELQGLKDWMEGPINQSGFITYVPLPELDGVDQCKKTARAPFVKALTAALNSSILNSRSQSYTADFPYASVEARSWENVFKSITGLIGL